MGKAAIPYDWDKYSFQPFDFQMRDNGGVVRCEVLIQVLQNVDVIIQVIS